MRSSDGSVDYTDAMAEVEKKRAQALQGKISGFIFQKKSPSCGMERGPIASADGKPADRTGVGMFMQHFTRHYPLIPMVLLKHHLRNHPVGYLTQQHYLKPYPDTLALRSQI